MYRAWKKNIWAGFWLNNPHFKIVERIFTICRTLKKRKGVAAGWQKDEEN